MSAWHIREPSMLVGHGLTVCGMLSLCVPKLLDALRSTAQRSRIEADVNVDRAE